MAAHYLSVLALLAFLAPAALAAPGDDGVPAKQVLGAGQLSENLIKADAWRPYEQGFERADGAFLCENGPDASVRRGAAQSVVLDQTTPLPIVARAWSRAEGVGGSADTSYSLYLDLTYTDGTPLWGQTADFRTGTHDWERGEVVVLPEKPVRSVSVYVLLRGHAGRAWFRDVELRQARPDAGAVMFDGLAVVPRGPAVEGFQVRDVAAGGDFVHIRHGALGLRLDARAGGCLHGRHPHRHHGQGPRGDPPLLRTGRAGGPALAGGRAPERAGRAGARVHALQPVRGRRQRAAVEVSVRGGGRARRRDRARHRPGLPRLLPRRLQRRQRGTLPGLRPGPDARAPLRAAAALPVRLRAPVGLPRRRWSATTACCRTSSAAARPSRASGCRSRRSARSRAGRTSASSSRRATARPRGTTRTAS